MNSAMNTLDKYIVKAFAVNYVISLAALTIIYVVLDLFFNYEEFNPEGMNGGGEVLAAMARYYGAHMFWIFAQISGVITVFAMAFALARLQRNNEFVAIVSSGVSLHRIALSVIMTGVFLNALWLLDQEIVIPRLAPRLAQDHAAAATNKPYGIWFVKDSNGALLSASEFERQSGQLRGVLFLRNDQDDIVADRATWEPNDDGRTGRWLLDRGKYLKRRVGDDGAYELYEETAEFFESDLNPDAIALRQSRNWIQFLGRKQLAEISRLGLAPPEQIARAQHNRFATPIVNMLILMIGIPIFLDRNPAGIVRSGGKCLLICGTCFLFAFFSQNLTSDSYPVLTAWLPLILLTPVMVVSFDRMKT